MSTETGVDYIKKIFSYNAKSGIYYKNIAGEYILIADSIGEAVPS